MGRIHFLVGIHLIDVQFVSNVLFHRSGIVIRHVRIRIVRSNAAAFASAHGDKFSRELGYAGVTSVDIGLAGEGNGIEGVVGTDKVIGFADGSAPSLHFSVVHVHNVRLGRIADVLAVAFQPRVEIHLRTVDGGVELPTAGNLFSIEIHAGRRIGGGSNVLATGNGMGRIHFLVGIHLIDIQFVSNVLFHRSGIVIRHIRIRIVRSITAGNIGIKRNRAELNLTGAAIFGVIVLDDRTGNGDGVANLNHVSAVALCTEHNDRIIGQAVHDHRHGNVLILGGVRIIHRGDHTGHGVLTERATKFQRIRRLQDFFVGGVGRLVILAAFIVSRSLRGLDELQDVLGLTDRIGGVVARLGDRNGVIRTVGANAILSAVHSHKPHTESLIVGENRSAGVLEEQVLADLTVILRLGLGVQIHLLGAVFVENLVAVAGLLHEEVDRLAHLVGGLDELVVLGSTESI